MSDYKDGDLLPAGEGNDDGIGEWRWISVVRGAKHYWLTNEVRTDWLNAVITHISKTPLESKWYDTPCTITAADIKDVITGITKLPVFPNYSADMVSRLKVLVDEFALAFKHGTSVAGYEVFAVREPENGWYFAIDAGGFTGHYRTIQELEQHKAIADYKLI